MFLFHFSVSLGQDLKVAQTDLSLLWAETTDRPVLTGPALCSIFFFLRKQNESKKQGIRVQSTNTKLFVCFFLGCGLQSNCLKRGVGVLRGEHLPGTCMAHPNTEDKKKKHWKDLLCPPCSGFEYQYICIYIGICICIYSYILSPTHSLKM